MAEQNNNEVMIQLPWTLPQQPLVMTQISVDPSTKKIPIDLNVNSTDWVAVGAIVLSLLAFIVTIYIVRESTKSQIDINRELIKSNENQKRLEMKNYYYKEWGGDLLSNLADLNCIVMKWSAAIATLSQKIIIDKESQKEVNQAEYDVDNYKEINEGGERAYKIIERIEVLLVVLDINSNELKTKYIEIRKLMNQVMVTLGKTKQCENNCEKLFRTNRESTELVLTRLKGNLNL